MVPVFHLHLVSDSTGETVSSVARAAASQFPDMEAEEHIWSLVRSVRQMERVVDAIRERPGIVMYTLVDDVLAQMLQTVCTSLSLPCIPILARVLREMSNYLGVETHATVGGKHALDKDYFERVEAINFALAHDDGQAHWNLEEADVVLVGPSRTSKSPTCMYLAYRGVYAANVPFVPDVPLPENLFILRKPLVVGLTIQPERLIQIRRARLQSMQENTETAYTDDDRVQEEMNVARRLFRQHSWPVIDVTRRSVEETAATIVQHLQKHQEKARAIARNGLSGM